MVYNQDITIWMPEFTYEVKSSTSHLKWEATKLNLLAQLLEWQNQAKKLLGLG